MDFHQLIEAIDINRLIIIDYIDCLSMIDSHRLGKLGYYSTIRPLSVIPRERISKSCHYLQILYNYEGNITFLPLWPKEIHSSRL